MLRLGLCCSFRDEPIAFKTTTATALARMPRNEALDKLSALCLQNADALMAALAYCHGHGIGCFRINSQILPCKTHPTQGYGVADLPHAAEVTKRFRACGAFAATHGVRMSFHPDQFVVLNSARPDVVEKSLEELEYQAEVAEWVGADVINIHGGGAFGDKPAALALFAKNLARLSDRARQRLTLENDDRLYTPADLLPLCRSEGIPLVYDVHHHRCHGDGLGVEEATALAAATWNREPLFHVSSPIEGWTGARPERHHDFVAVEDVPASWLGMTLTVEVEAKAKELAVAALQRDIAALGTGKRKVSRKRQPTG